MNTAAEPRDGLLPCPGCGFCNTRVIGGPGTRGGPKYWAGCDTCHWRTWGNTEHDAIAEWNTRIAQARPEAGAINVPAAQALISHGITPAHAQRQEGE